MIFPCLDLAREKANSYLFFLHVDETQICRRGKKNGIFHQKFALGSSIRGIVKGKLTVGKSTGRPHVQDFDDFEESVTETKDFGRSVCQWCSFKLLL